MKFSKILSLVLAVLMLALCVVACDNGDKTATDGTTDAVKQKVTIKVNIKVSDDNGKVVYEKEGYNYTGDEPNLITLLEDYLYMEKDIELEYDGKGLTVVGTVEAGEVTSHNADTNTDEVVATTYWWYKINGKEGNAAMDEYVPKNGDSIEYYLKVSTN